MSSIPNTLFNECCNLETFSLKSNNSDVDENPDYYQHLESEESSLKLFNDSLTLHLDMQNSFSLSIGN